MTYPARWVLATLVVWAASRDAAADSVLDRAEAPARERFLSMVARYHGLPYYKDEGAFTRIVSFGDREQKEVTSVIVQFAKPDRLLLNAGEIEIVADGKTLKTVLHPTHRIRETSSAGPLRFNQIADDAAGAILFGGFVGTPTQLLLKSLLGETGSDALPDRTSALKLGPDRHWEGKTYACLLLEQGDEPTLEVYLDPESLLIRRMEYRLSSEGLADKVPAGARPSQMSLVWNSGPIQTSLPENVTFALAHPEAYQPIVPAKPKAAPAEAANPLIGKLSPDFKLDVISGANSTRTLTRQDLKGKIVILDFWATWCGPCLLELPEIQALADNLAKAKAEDVVIVAVSQDRKPDGDMTVRKLVEDLLESRKLKLSGGPISQVALDPDQTNGDLFGIEALPTLIVIDAKGVVQAVHVGFDEQIQATLMDEIGHLRDGKPVAPAPAQTK